MFPTSTVGRKILMAITGQMMVLFVIVHLIGNTTVYFHGLNAYAAALHALPVLVWAFRLFMAVTLCLHVYLGIVLTLENWKAKPGSYAVSSHISTTFAGRNMIWTGSLISVFLVYHLLHFTLQFIDPAISALKNPDALGRPDVFMMVTRSFLQIGIVSFYVVSVTGLLLHLYHGIQSSIQTWGLNNESSLPVITRGGQIAATILFLGYAAIPVVIVMGIVK
ncbi:MAG: succinate dehydrogenase cytochrome b subunit [Nitrospirae bacterium]|nr:succinate dehydrogenase cytochrome b subunit [Nitrospirota bacterium]